MKLDEFIKEITKFPKKYEIYEVITKPMEKYQEVNNVEPFSKGGKHYILLSQNI